MSFSKELLLSNCDTLLVLELVIRALDSSVTGWKVQQSRVWLGSWVSSAKYERTAAACDPPG